MTEPIAVVGTACRFPGSATSPSKLWELLKSPRDVVRKFPEGRLNLSNFYSDNGELHGRTDVQNQAYLLDEDVRLFDAAFFRINPQEAAGLDPQHRILLETVYEAFEAAGWPLEALEGSPTSVHVGVMTDDYYTIQARDPDTMGSHAATGLSRCVLSNRVSYAFDLKGPSMTVDTACSSSLVALHLAVQGLRKGEASQAVVAGSNLLLDPHWFITESSLHMLSPDSHSRMWDKSANGYARGEGCAAVVLKPLSLAMKQGDHIQCIIRETGVNSDGRTNGLTMPSPTAQAALIRQTYLDAGLDPVADRCQYFECHGTGTQAGDPVEARAIRDAFFPPGSSIDDTSRPLHCGSIKTVIGHLEGCAGLAGLLKASLAVQHGQIPPNMHFNELNPSVEPFYGSLQIPKSLLPWPETHGKPRRASINSFGFGGTNAHVIIESYDSCIPEHRADAAGAVAIKGVRNKPHVVGPFVFSARSRTALSRSLTRTLEYLELNSSLDLDALSYFLQSRRSCLSYRTSISAVENPQQLAAKLEEQIQLATDKSTSDSFGIRALTETKPDTQPGILGIFTGQGAQAAQMGQQLLKSCKLFRESIDQCENALSSLPEAPSWSLRQELAADDSTSRVSEAQISQPLCTAVQIALVDVLKASGVYFSAVVGHSSGEIGAAYAAGLLNRRDAMGIAYYRGHVAHLARGPGGKRGSMMAAAMTTRDAIALCAEPRFSGRVGIAASNAPSSVTLSGDADAIKEVKAHLDERKIQARELRVDTAYHSHHMLGCASAYLGHLQRLNVQVQAPPDNRTCAWLSSVRNDTDMTKGSISQKGLDGQYWVDNMVQPVLFSEAVQFAAKNSKTSFAIGVEVGPHPALKGPVGQSLKPLTPTALPYIGCLDRSKDGMETFSVALGTIWGYLGPSAVDFSGWREACGLSRKSQMLQDFPSYAWDHDQVYWRESRVSHNFRVAGPAPHDLLGRQREDTQYEKTWRNIFHLHEMPWVRGHMFQGQVLFPGAGYVSLAIEAAKAFVQNRPIKMLELQDMSIPKGLVMDENDGVEIIFSMRSQVLASSVKYGSVLETEFVSYSSSDARVLDKNCQGRLFIHLGKAEAGDLPPSSWSQSELTPLSEDRFYRAVSEIDLNYDGVFRTLHSISRSWGRSRASASWAKGSLEIGCALHPALLDVAFQAGLATFVSTAEKSMGTPYLPIGIKRAIIDPNQTYQGPSGLTNIDIEAIMATAKNGAVEVDISVCPASDYGNCGIQIDGLVLKAIAEPQPSEDRNLFVNTVWAVDGAYGLTPPPPVKIDKEESSRMIDDYERITLFFMRNLIQELRQDEVKSAQWYHQELCRFINATVALVDQGNHAVLQKEWLFDDRQTIDKIVNHYPDNVDVQMLTTVGENLPAVVRGQSGMMEHMLQDDLLSRLYKESAGLAACNQYVAGLMRQITHKHPRTKILEIGAGTGGTTVGILEAIGDAYASYTCTDISASFFGGLADKIPEKHSTKFDFKVFNVEQAPALQDFTEGSYDVVVAANVLHATRHLSETIRNARSLLRPGGYLIAIEVTGNMLRETGLMGGLEGWWLGVDEGRRMGPGVDPKQWDAILEQNGFSGIDCIIHDHPDISRHSCSVFVTQAMDDRLSVLRDPLFSMDLVPGSPLLIIGGKALAVSKLARRVQRMLRQWSPQVKTCDSIDNLDAGQIAPGTFILCLSDLDKPFFAEPPNPSKLNKLQEMLGAAHTILWVTCGRLLEDPYANMMVGIGRALAVELPHVTMHYLDFGCARSWSAEVLACHVLRMAMTLGSAGMKDMLWIQEPEVVVQNGEMLIPRIVPDNEANEILNARRRRVSKLVDSSSRIELRMDSVSAQPVLSTGLALDVPEQHVSVNVKFSLALHTAEEKPCFLCCGRIRDRGMSTTEETIMTLSEVDSSTLVAPVDGFFGCSDAAMQNADVLVGTATALIAAHVVSSFPSRGTTLVYGVGVDLAKAISAAAEKTSRKVSFVVVSSSLEKTSPGWIVVHPRAAKRTIRHLLPLDTFLLLNFSSTSVDGISDCLPQNCIVQSFEPASLFRQTPAENTAAIAKAYQEYTAADHGNMATEHRNTIVGIADVPRLLNVHRERLSVVLDWERQGPVNAVVQSLESQRIFSTQKTYFLVGMAGELGQSLCRFMVRAGARHIVLASRNPSEDPHWIKELRSTGADIRVVKMDVTKAEQVRETVAMLRKTMPELGGVANAALVFEAGIFVNFSADDVARQLKPKVDGTVHLDREFSQDKLEFFLTFGSLATVCGNPGQAMYHAGNMFMSSMVERRRRRGQAASILNFGLLVDVGYVARMDRADGSNIEGTLRSLLLTPLSEAEFHHLVLQGIISGRPGSATGEVIMGMAPYVDDGKAASRPPWVDKSFFSHMIHAPEAAKGPVTSQASTTVTMQHLRENLERASDAQQVTEAVQELFYKKIELMVKIPKASIDPNSPLADLGLDSLHGIDIRKWLLEDMQINIPLLRILGREPLKTLYSSVAQMIMNTRGLQNTTNSTEAAAAEPETTKGSVNIEPGTADVLKSTVPSTQPLKSPESAAPSRPQSPPSSLATTSSSIDDAGWTDSSSAAERQEADALAGISSSPSPAFEGPLMLSVQDSPIPLEFQRSERLSFAQSGIHFLHTFLDDPTAFNVTTRYAIKGRLNIDRLSRAVEKTLLHHEAFRTCFVADSGSSQVRQHVASNLNLRRLTQIASTKDQADGQARLAFDSIANTEYQLAAGEAFRAVLITHAPERHTLVIGFHLIASDALSFSILLRDLDRAYQMLPLPSNTSTYIDHTREQYEDLAAHRYEGAIAYWRRELEPQPTPLPLLPVAKTRTRRARRTYENNIVERELDVDMARRIRHASKTSGATQMQFYMAAMQVLLARLADVDDVCIGVTDSGRSRTGNYADAVGHFANILPIRFRINPKQTFENLLSRTSHTVLNAFDNSKVPFDVLLERMGIERSPVYTPLFQVAFNYRVGDILQRPLGDCIMSMEKYVDVKTPYDFVINVTQTGLQGHLIECITNASLYSTTATEFITDTFIGLVESLTIDKSVRVCDAKLFTTDQVERAITLGRGPSVKYEWPETLTERFHQVVSMFPDSVAIKDAGASLTYTQLSRRIASIFAALSAAGSAPGSRIAVLCEPSIDLYATMLAILHIGAVYVPLDVSLPNTRRRNMINACEPDMLVFHSTTFQAAAECSGNGGIRMLNLSNLKDPWTQDLPKPRALSATADAFILFTSGSTGTPKGIRLGQRGIMNYAASKSSMLGFGQVKVLQQTSSGFDMSIAQVFNALANGGTLVIAPSKARGDPSMISQIMLQEAINFTLCTPSEYMMLAAHAADTLRQCTSWRYACSGGEVVTQRLLQALRRLDLPRLTFTDCYGPTEVSCATTFRVVPLRPEVADGTNGQRVDDETSSVVGRAIPNTSVYIIGEDGKSALPPGMPGEICVGGSGVSAGYLDASLNRNKFVPNPFATPEELNEGRGVMYKTGDKGFLGPDGSLAFLGRTDGGETVVKLRGLRIDLTEVSNAILEAATEVSLADAVVVSRGEPQFLVAYVVYSHGQILDQARLDMLLQDLALPRYMIPSAIVPLDRLPTTANGKVDIATLKTLPLRAKPGQEDKASSTLTVPEGELRVIWQDILGEAAGSTIIGPDSDFFTVGGSSLLLVRLQSALRERTGVALSLQELYQATTLRRMAAAMHSERGQLTDETIDWNTETAIPNNTFEAARAGPSHPRPQARNRQVLLTGANSFLGGEILRRLVADSDVAKIHCVAVSDDERQKLATENSDKVLVYAGSLTSPTLGLSATEMDSLKLTVDQIIHAAVQGHCMNNYSSVKHALYSSTQFLVSLALPRRIPFHLISAPRVVLLSGQHEGGPVSMDAHYPPTDGSQGVTAAKWASESFLEKVARETALPVTIHRHCALIGERAPADDVMNSVVRYSLLTRKVPNVAGAEGFFDFKDVVAVASEIESQRLAVPGSVTFCHHSSDVRVPFDQLAQRLGALYGGEFDVVDPSVWLKAASEFGMGELLVIHLKANMESGKPMVFPYLGK